MLTIEWVLGIAGVMLVASYGLLTTVLGAIGNKVYYKLDELSKTMRNIEADLHGKIGELDRRVTRVEAKCDINHRSVNDGK